MQDAPANLQDVPAKLQNEHGVPQTPETLSRHLALAHPLVLHPAQISALATLCRPCPRITLVCGRRFGKTTLLALDIAAHVLFFPRIRILLLAPTHDQALRTFATAVGFVRGAIANRAFGEAEESAFDFLMGEGVIRHARSKVVRVSCHGLSDRLRGLGATPDTPGLRIYVDERGQIPDDVLDAVAVPMLASVPPEMACLIQAGTPGNATPAFRRDFVAGQADGSSFHAPASAHPAVSAAFLQSQKARLPPAVYAREYDALFADTGAGGGVRVTETEVNRAFSLRLPLRPPDARAVGIVWDFDADEAHVALVGEWDEAARGAVCGLMMACRMPCGRVPDMVESLAEWLAFVRPRAAAVLASARAPVSLRKLLAAVGKSVVMETRLDTPEARGILADTARWAVAQNRLRVAPDADDPDPGNPDPDNPDPGNPDPGGLRHALLGNPDGGNPGTIGGGLCALGLALSLCRDGDAGVGGVTRGARQTPGLPSP